MHFLSTLRAVRLAAALVFAATACTSDSSTDPARAPSGSLTVAPIATEVFEGDVLSMHAVVRDASGREIPDASVAWSSADTTIALVTSVGQVTSLRPGAAQITARSGDLTASLTLTIRPLTVLQVTVLGLPDTLGSGDISAVGVRAQGEGGRDVHGRQVKLASTNPEIALIDASGRVRAVTAGTATISAAVDGVVGTARVVVAGEPADLELVRSDGHGIPILLEGDSLSSNGVVEYREIYLESGSLQLSGGAQPRYQTVLHLAWYAVTFDASGQRHLVLRAALDELDHGSVRYDERGDLVMTSEAISDFSHDASASAETGGFTMRYRVPAANVASTLFFRREPK